MKNNKNPDICASIYNGGFDASFSCAGVEACKFALCPVMPPTGDDPCCFVDCGECRSMVARAASIEALRARLAKELKQIDEEREQDT